MRAFFFGGKVEMPKDRKPTKLKIQYDGYDPEFDAKIRIFLESQGFEWQGQGINIVSGMRDVSFKRHPGMR